MRIGLALHGWPPASMGGTGLYVEALALALARLGHTPLLLAPGRPGSGITRVGLFKNRVLGWLVGGESPRRFEHTWAESSAEGQVTRWLDEVRPEILHVHHLSGLPWRLVGAAQARGVPVALTLHDYAIPCARGQLVDRELRACPGPEPGRCAVCISEQLRLHPLNAWLGRALGALPRFKVKARAALPAPAGARAQARVEGRIEAARDLLSAVEVLLAPSRDLARRFGELGLREPSVFELPLLRPVPPAPAPGEGPLRILFASAIIPTKGPDRLLQAFAALPPGSATLTVAGPPSPFDGAPGFAEDLRHAVEATPGATWLGAVAPERVPALLGQHDLLVLPSLWPENSPLIAREAAAAGLRLILPERGGASEIDPRARRVPNLRDDGGALSRALLAEVGVGRGRLEPRRWPSPEEHARWLVDAVYSPAIRGS